MEGIKLVGHGGHSSNPAFGVNAIEAMHKVMGELLQWREELQQAHQDPRFTVPVPTLNLGHIHGGDNPNRICETCELHFDLRPLPGMPLDNLRSELKDRLAKVLKDSKISWELFPLFHGTPAMHTDEHSPIVRSCEHLSGEHSHAVAFCTEAPYLNQLGIDTVVLGPGDIAQAHQPDEFLALERVRPTVELLRRLIAEYCL
jgi:acetylornithine deacetylase